MIKKLAPFVTVGALLIGLALMWNTLEARALPAPDTDAVLPPENTPAAPEVDVQPPLSLLPSSLEVAGAVERAQPGEPVAEQQIQDEAHAQQALQHAEALRQAGVRFQVTDPGARAAESLSPQSPSQTCWDMLSNPQMDVETFEENGTEYGYIDPWVILLQQIYHSDTTYHSASYSLMMADESGGDGSGDTGDWDIDAFGQAFYAPAELQGSELVSITVTFSSYFVDVKLDNETWVVLWTLDSEGSLDYWVAAGWIDDSYTGWVNWTWPLGSSSVAGAAGKDLALVFEMDGTKTGAEERVYLDDAQVTLCYEPSGSTLDEHVYLPVTFRNYANQPICTPYEPDAVDRRGSTQVGATCSGSFSSLDTRDYYSLNLSGVSNVRLRLYDLPSGTNWDALIYEDTGGSPYPLACQIGDPGDDDKSVNCTLNPSKSYFVLVNAGTPPSGGNTYKMSVEQR